ANLQLAKGDSRLKEIAVRGALGASKWQIARQLLTESLVLSIVGGFVGIGLSFALIKIFLSLAPPFSMPSDMDVKLYPPVLLFTVGTTLLAGLIFGLAPAWQAARRDVGERLKQANSRSGQGHGSHRMGKILVI